jgi:hypothetical protein
LHLREFGALVWILLQGQKKPLKLQPHLKQFYYVGCEDESKSVLYYSPETRKVLISQNFCFLNLPTKEIPPEEVTINFLHDKPKEGESMGDITQINRSKRKNKMKNKTLMKH